MERSVSLTLGILVNLVHFSHSFTLHISLFYKGLMQR